MVWSAENLVPIGVVTWLGSGCACTDQRHGLRQAVAAADTRDGGRADRSCVDLERGPTVPRAAMAAASDGVSKQWWWEAARRGGLSRRGVSTRLASRASPGLRGPLGGQESPLNEAFLSLRRSIGCACGIYPQHAGTRPSVAVSS